MNKFGTRIRELRNAKGYSLRQLAPLVGVGFTYLSKIENGKLDFGDAPSAELIGRLAMTLDANSDELMLVAGKMPEHLRQRVMERPDAFIALAYSTDIEIDAFLASANN